MSDFVRKPLMQQLNKDNPITRIENLENQGVPASAVVNSISELSVSGSLGEMTSGKFNFYDPNTGQLVGYLSSIPLPGYPTYYFVMTDSAGNVQFSVDPTTSGATTMGNGNVTINESGIAIANTNASYIWKDASNNTNTIYSYATTDNNLIILNRSTGGNITLTTYGSILLTTRLTDLTTPQITWKEDPASANRALLTINGSPTPTKIIISDGIYLMADQDGTETVFNESSYDVDFRIEGATVSNVFKVDAGNDRVEIGADHYIATRSSANKNTYFNEANQDMDFNVQGTTDDNLIYVDASTNRVGMGTATPAYMLDIVGDVNLATGGVFRVNGTNILAAGSITIPVPLMTHGNSGTIPASTTYYIPPSSAMALSATVNNAITAVAGTLKNFYVRTTSAQPGTGTLVCTVMINNVASAITFTIAAGAAGTSYSDLTHTATVVAGDLITFRLVNNATGASAGIGACSAQLNVTNV